MNSLVFTPVTSFAEGLSSACSWNDSVILQVYRNTGTIELSPDHYEFGMTCQWNITVENDSVRDYLLYINACMF